MIIDVIKIISLTADGAGSDIYGKFIIGAAIFSVVVGFILAARSAAKKLMEEENGKKPKKKSRKS